LSAPLRPVGDAGIAFAQSNTLFIKRTAPERAAICRYCGAFDARHALSKTFEQTWLAEMLSWK
jgi:hypothetical protein